MNLTQAPKCLVIVVVYLMLLGIFRIVGDTYCLLWLPLLRAELTWLLPVDALTDISVTMRAGEQVYLAQIALDKLPTSAFGNNISVIATVSALSGNVVQSLLIVLTLVLATNKLDVRRKCRALPGTIVIVVLLFSLDLPWVMRGAVEDLWCAQKMAGCLPTSNLSRYGFALDRGGRLALAVLGAWALIESMARKK